MATPAGTRSTCSASAMPKPRAPSRWPASRTSTSASTWSTTCWSRPTARAWPTRSSCGSRSSTSASPISPSALATPLKVRGLAKKRLLRRALAPLLPREILRGPKQGFSIPLAAWLRGAARAVRPRDPLGGEPRAAGLPRPRRGRPDPRPPLLRQGGPQPSALGPDVVHTLVRSLCPLASTRSSPSCSRASWRCCWCRPPTACAAGRRDRLPERTLPARGADAEARRPRDPRRGPRSPA